MDQFGLSSLQRKKTLQKDTRKEIEQQNAEIYRTVHQDAQAQGKTVMGWAFNDEIRVERKYDYSQRSRRAERATDGVPGVPAGVQAAKQVQAADEGLSKDQKEAMKLEKKAMVHEYNMMQSRNLRLMNSKEDGISDEDLKDETKLVKEKLAAIDKAASAAEKELKFGDSEGKLKVRIQAQKDRVFAYAKYAKLLPVDSKVRFDAMEEKEKMEVKLSELKREAYLIDLKKSGRKEEYDRERSADSRHGRMKAVRDLLGNPDLIYSHQDSTYVNPLDRKLLVNEGRLFFGGTKPMYLFSQRDKSGKVEKEFLYKEAVNCCGFKKEDRAYATVAAANVQRIVCGVKHAVPAFVALNRKGEAVGTFQEKLKKVDGGFDLFEWQSSPKKKLKSKISDQLLREHVLDWLLCNYDTKGENFLNTGNDELTSIDKEASFTYLEEPEADHMSMEYAPHGNDTIYNVMFRRFTEGDSESMEDLNLDVVESYITQIESLSTDEYMENFKDMLAKRYKKEPEKIPGAYAKIAARKDNIREEYRKFFGAVLKKKLDNAKTMKQKNAFYAKYGECLDLTDPANPIFKFTAERISAKLDATSTTKKNKKPAVTLSKDMKKVVDKALNQKASGADISGATTEVTEDIVLQKTLTAKEALAADDTMTGKIFEAVDQQVKKTKNVIGQDPNMLFLNLEAAPAKMKTDAALLANAKRISEAYGKMQDTGAEYDLCQYYSKMVDAINDTQRADKEGKKRKKYYDMEFEDPSYKAMVDESVQNLLANLYKDKLLYYANTAVATPEEQQLTAEKFALRYLGANYFEKIDGRMQSGEAHATGDMKTVMKNTAMFAGAVNNIFKSDTVGFFQLGVIRSEYESLQEAFELLSKEQDEYCEKHDGEGSTFISGMLESVAEMIRMKKPVYEKAMKGTLESFSYDRDFDEPVRDTNMNTMRVRLTQKIVAERKDTLVAIANRLRVLDRTAALSPEEVKEREDLVRQLEQFSIEESDLVNEKRIVTDMQSQLQEFKTQYTSSYTEQFSAQLILRLHKDGNETYLTRGILMQDDKKKTFREILGEAITSMETKLAEVLTGMTSDTSSVKAKDNDMVMDIAFTLAQILKFKPQA